MPTSQPSARLATRIFWPGSAVSSASATSSAQWAVPVLPISAVRSSTSCCGAGPDALAHRADGAGVQAGDDHVVEVADGQAGRLQRVADGLLGERDVGELAEALLPLLGVRRARLAPAVDELGRHGRRRRSVGDRVALAERPHDGGVAAVGLVGAAGQPGADVAEHGEPVHRLGHLDRGDAAARRADACRTPPRCGRGRARRGSPWRWSCRRRPAPWWRRRRRSGGTPSPAIASAMRPASTPSDVVSSSKLATLRVPLPPPLPSAPVIALRCSRQYGMYAPYATSPAMESDATDRRPLRPKWAR